MTARQFALKAPAAIFFILKLLYNYGLCTMVIFVSPGRIQPLLLDGGSPELRIMSDRIEGASLFAPPDTDTDLVIELKPVWV